MTQKRKVAVKKNVKQRGPNKSKKIKTIATNKPTRRRQTKVSYIPKGDTSITPYFIIENAAKVVSFCKSVFGAKEVFRMNKPDGKIGHVELTINDAKIMLADKWPQLEAMTNKKYGSGAINIYLYVKNVDAVVKKALLAGASLIIPVENKFYGDRSGIIKDPFGNLWCVATHIEDIPLAKIKKLAKEFYGKK